MATENRRVTPFPTPTNRRVNLAPDGRLFPALDTDMDPARRTEGVGAESFCAPHGIPRGSRQPDMEPMSVLERHRGPRQGPGTDVEVLLYLSPDSFMQRPSNCKLTCRQRWHEQLNLLRLYIWPVSGWFTTSSVCG